MLIKLSDLIDKYNVCITGVLHVGAHECEEIHDYEKYIGRDKILWIEAIPEKVEHNRRVFSNLLIEQAAVSDKVETVQFHVANNGQSSSILELGTHQTRYPHIFYSHSFSVETKTLGSIIQSPAYENITFNFLNLDIQGAELKALQGMDEYLRQGKVDYIYTEVNQENIYKDCCFIHELDEYLSEFHFDRLETEWVSDHNWGDAFYMRRPTTHSVV